MEKIEMYRGKAVVTDREKISVAVPLKEFGLLSYLAGLASAAYPDHPMVEKFEILFGINEESHE